MPRKFLMGIDLASQRAINLASPTAATDAANKAYVDQLVNGLSWKDEVRAASTTNGALATAYANGSTLDGVTLATGDRILLKDQTTQTENGIYVVNASGAPTRSQDADSAAELNNATVKVTLGTVNGLNGGSTFTQTTPNPTVGTSNIVFVNSSSSSLVQGNGISIASNVISAVIKSGGGLLLDGTGISIDPAGQYARKAPYAINVPTTGTTVTITHGLNTTDIGIFVYDISVANSLVMVEADPVITGVNTITLTFAVTPTTGQYRVVIFG